MSKVIYKFQLPEECLDEFTVTQCYFHLDGILNGILNKDPNLNVNRYFGEIYHSFKNALGLHVSRATHEVTYSLDNIGNICLCVRPFDHVEKFINEVETVIEDGGWISEKHRRLYEELALR